MQEIVTLCDKKARLCTHKRAQRDNGRQGNLNYTLAHLSRAISP